MSCSEPREIWINGKVISWFGSGRFGRAVDIDVYGSLRSCGQSTSGLRRISDVVSGTGLADRLPRCNRPKFVDQLNGKMWAGRPVGAAC
jgi:hypothetical protein